MKPLFSIFLLSFILNFIWENLHSYLYTGYMGGKITEIILLRASVIDALIITAISLPFIYFAFLKNKSWLIIFIGIIISIIIEFICPSFRKMVVQSIYAPHTPIVCGFNPGSPARLSRISFFSACREEIDSKGSRKHL